MSILQRINLLAMLMRQCTRFTHINVIERGNSTFIVNYSIMYLLFLLDLLMREVIIINVMFRNIILYPADTGQVITNFKDKNCVTPKAYKWVNVITVENGFIKFVLD